MPQVAAASCPALGMQQSRVKSRDNGLLEILIQQQQQQLRQQQLQLQSATAKVTHKQEQQRQQQLKVANM